MLDAPSICSPALQWVCRGWEVYPSSPGSVREAATAPRVCLRIHWLTPAPLQHEAVGGMSSNLLTVVAGRSIRSHRGY